MATNHTYENAQLIAFFFILFFYFRLVLSSGKSSNVVEYFISRCIAAEQKKNEIN